MRRCVGCMESKPKAELIRVAYYEGVLTLDVTGKAKGRGAYLCKDPQCLKKAQKKNALARSFGENPGREQVDRLYEELEAYAEKD